MASVNENEVGIKKPATQRKSDHTSEDSNEKTRPLLIADTVPTAAATDAKDNDTDVREKDWTATDILPSVLGTKSYWKQNYQQELDNYLGHGDEGEVWFGAQNEARIVRYVAKKFPKTVSIVDIGCGNGHLLLSLAKEQGFVNLTGIDYVDEAIKLAKKIAAESCLETDIKFMKCDILTPDCCGSYDIIVDKGTYDAICLMPKACLKKNRKDYIESIKRLINKAAIDSSRFLLTSCNWTKDELLQHFQGEFDLVDELPTPKFSFGGKEGRTVTSLVFRIIPKS